MHGFFQELLLTPNRPNKALSGAKLAEFKMVFHGVISAKLEAKGEKKNLDYSYAESKLY